MTSDPYPNRPPGPEDFERDLGSEVEEEDREELLALAVRLSEQRPVPRAGWRGAIRARLLGRGTRASRSRVGALIFGYAASGALLLVIAAAGLVGLGPFAA